MKILVTGASGFIGGRFARFALEQGFDVRVSVLILFMGFIVWDLAKKSKAGRFGSMILFFVLGLGVAAFVIKSVVIGLIESGAL